MQTEKEVGTVSGYRTEGAGWQETGKLLTT